MAPPQNPDVAYALADQKARLPYITKRRNYYEGRHETVIPEVGSVRNNDLRELLTHLSDNMCDDVVDETVDRLEVVAWSSADVPDVVPAAEPDPVTGETPPAAIPEDRLGQRATDLWEANRGPAREPRTYREALWAGDSWTIVQADTSAAGVTVVYDYPQMPEQMGCAYRSDRPDTIRVAWKIWREGQAWRLNLYYGADSQDGLEAGYLERYATKGSTNDGGMPRAAAFLPVVEDLEDPESSGLRPDWDRCPVFHYPNGEVGQYGRSVLSDVIPLQDVLNKAIQDLVVNGEDVALPQRWGTGVQVEYDRVTGEQVPLRRSSKRASDLLATGSKDSQFGQFAGADLSQHIAIIEGWRAEIARKGYLPMYSVNPGNAASAGASGLSMLVQEGRQVKRCKACQRDWGYIHAEKVAFMLRLSGESVVAADLQPEWQDPSTRDEQAMWELLSLKMALGVPKERLLVEGGYTPEQAREWTEASAAATGGRNSLAPGAGPMDTPLGGVASITQAGVPGGIPVPPGGAIQPSVAGAGSL